MIAPEPGTLTALDALRLTLYTVRERTARPDVITGERLNPLWALDLMATLEHTIARLEQPPADQ